MNFSIIKKVVACSMISALFITAANAQETSTASSSAKVFGGSSQYRTWSVGFNGGVLAPVIVIGGSNDFTNWNAEAGYGATIKKQLGHAFGVELGFLRGNLTGTNEKAVGGVANNRKSFDTRLSFAGSIMGVINVANMNFLQRENSVNLLLKAGYGIAGYDWSYITGANTTVNGGPYGTELPRNNSNIHEQFFPLGVGAKFKLSDRMSLNLGYNMYFLDGDNLDGTYAKETSKDKWSYGYGGLEFSLGSSSKPNLDWANPVAMMYDELKDPTLRQEVEALKGRVSALEGTVNQLGADSDGDGVSDKFDKCPGTPAGTAVDGAGCPIVHPTPAPVMVTTPMGSYANIQFEFDSSVLRTSAYPTLDQVSADMRANTGMTLEVDGYASAEGTDEYNMRLSKDRANSVKTYLVNSGVDASRLTVKAFGESNPIASNSTEEGRIQNRRVEFKK